MKKLFIILLKIVAGLTILVLLGCIIIYAIYNQPLPDGKQGEEADALATKMLDAVNFEAYRNTRYLEWSFADGAHRYKWDKKNGIVQVEWKENRILLNLNRPEKSTVFEKDIEAVGNSRSSLIQKALSYFNNDSFWLVAPFKIFDQGTQRSLVTLDDGTNGLLVTYTSGGSTPGDSYLWKLGDNGFPESFRMWVDIIPIGGVEATWDDWQVMQSGVFLPTSHQLGPISSDMGNVKAYK